MALKMLMLACLASFVAAKNVEVMSLDEMPTKMIEAVSQLGLDAAGCSCSAKECSCCVDVKNTKIIKFDVNFCANLALINNDQDVELTITVGGDTAYDKTFNISALSQLSEECVTLFSKVDGCLEISNFTNNATYIGACAGVELKIAGAEIAEYDIGCWGLTVSNKDACDQAILSVCGAEKGQDCLDCYTTNKAELDLDGCDQDLVNEICGSR